MQIKSISVSIRKKFNTGNYETVDVEVGLNAEIAVGEDEREIAQNLIAICKEEIKKAAPPSHKAKFGVAA